MPLAHLSPHRLPGTAVSPAVTPAEADPWEGAPPAQWFEQQSPHNKDEAPDARQALGRPQIAHNELSKDLQPRLLCGLGKKSPENPLARAFACQVSPTQS